RLLGKDEPMLRHRRPGLEVLASRVCPSHSGLGDSLTHVDSSGPSHEETHGSSGHGSGHSDGHSGEGYYAGEGRGSNSGPGSSSSGPGSGYQGGSYVYEVEDDHSGPGGGDDATEVDHPGPGG